MSHWIHVKAHPTRAPDEPKVGGSGTTRAVAESNHGDLLNPNRCCDSVRRKSVGRLTRTSVARDFQCRELRRQSMGRVGQSSSSESNSSRGGLAGFPTGNAARRNVSCKVGEAQ